VTGGDGNTTVLPQPDRKQVVRPDVAYVMDDIMKDVINRGTAAQAGGWGFRNVAGKTAFAGKTGTSRDGWFAGFTPELVCVVYVGFDNGDDLGMKGSDSAMPVWADFMQKALELHPEWNGDWPMPAGIRKAEIDIRNGALIRELDAFAGVTPTPTPSPTPVRPKDPELEQYYEPPPPEPKEVFVTNVPAEFRRIEIFIAGTVPNRAFLDLNEDDEIPVEGEPNPKPTLTPPPVNGTWTDGTDSAVPSESRDDKSRASAKTVTIMVCPVTGARATVNCPDKEARSHAQGTEPREFCTFHR
jgi:membrane peptidoglycan carboxypeptidase